MRAFHRSVVLAAVLALGSPAFATDPAKDVQGSGLPVPPQSPLPPLQLNDAQRDNVRKSVLTDHTKVGSPGQAAKDFQPAVGVKLPADVALNPLPRPLVYEIPVLKEYHYVKFKDQVLIVDGLTREIVDMFPET